jgi:hypothetical protein
MTIPYNRQTPSYFDDSYFDTIISQDMANQLGYDGLSNKLGQMSIDMSSGIQPSVGLFGENGWLNQNKTALGAGIGGLQALSGLAAMLDAQKTAKKQRQVLDQQIANNTTKMNNESAFVSQLKGVQEA